MIVLKNKMLNVSTKIDIINEWHIVKAHKKC